MRTLCNNLIDGTVIRLDDCFLILENFTLASNLVLSSLTSGTLVLVNNDTDGSAQITNNFFILNQEKRTQLGIIYNTNNQVEVLYCYYEEAANAGG